MCKLVGISKSGLRSNAKDPLLSVATYYSNLGQDLGQLAGLLTLNGKLGC